MENKENCFSPTFDAKKRAFEAISSQQNPFKKQKNRTVLAELQNFQQYSIVNLLPKNSKMIVMNKAINKKDDKHDDPLMCVAYDSDIYAYLREMENQEKWRPLPNYLEKVQKDVSSNMRGILVDWLVEVAEEYNLLSETLYLSISYIDRFLSTNIITRQRLQLLGVSSMLIASKYEEISHPNVEDFCDITDNLYNKQELVKMEADVLKVLNFEMGSPNIKSFLGKFIKIAQQDGETPDLEFEYLGCYLAEWSLLDYGCVRFLPSLIAASVIFLARFTLEPKVYPWSLNLQGYSGYRAADLKECVGIIHELQLRKRGNSSVAVREKYKQHKFRYVSTLSAPSNIPHSFFEVVKEQ